MRYILTTTLLALTVFAVSAQTKPQEPSKQTWSPDITKQVNVALNPTVQQLNDFLIFVQSGPALDQATDKTAKQVSDIKANAGIVFQAISKQFQEYLLADQKKFSADTAAVNHPKKK